MMDPPAIQGVGSGGTQAAEREGRLRTTEACLLCVVSVEAEALCLVLDDVGGDGWVMRDLFYKEICAAL